MSKLKPIELECNMGKDINGVEHREPWKAYDIDEVDALLAKKDKEIAELKDKLQNVSELLNETREWLIESQKLHKRCADNAIKTIRHQKYKRRVFRVACTASVAENTKQRRSKFARLVDAEHAKRVKQVLRAEYQRAVTEVQFWDTILQTCPHYRNRYFDRLHGLNYSQSYKGRTAAAWLEYWRGRVERVSNWLREFRPRRRGAKCK